MPFHSVLTSFSCEGGEGAMQTNLYPKPRRPCLSLNYLTISWWVSYGGSKGRNTAGEGDNIQTNKKQSSKAKSAFFEARHHSLENWKYEKLSSGQSERKLVKWRIRFTQFTFANDNWWMSKASLNGESVKVSEKKVLMRNTIWILHKYWILQTSHFSNISYREFLAIPRQLNRRPCHWLPPAIVEKHYHRALWETCDPWDMSSERWGDMTWPTKWQWQWQWQRVMRWHDLTKINYDNYHDI